jgi:hypothetical protein
LQKTPTAAKSDAPNGDAQADIAPEAKPFNQDAQADFAPEAKPFNQDPQADFAPEAKPSNQDPQADFAPEAKSRGEKTASAAWPLSPAQVSIIGCDGRHHFITSSVVTELGSDDGLVIKATKQLQPYVQRAQATLFSPA